MTIECHNERHNKGMQHVLNTYRTSLCYLQCTHLSEVCSNVMTSNDSCTGCHGAVPCEYAKYSGFASTCHMPNSYTEVHIDFLKMTKWEWLHVIRASGNLPLTPSRPKHSPLGMAKLIPFTALLAGLILQPLR